jgi:hypothetical protein
MFFQSGQATMNTILEGPCRMPFFTDLGLIFEAFGGRQNEYNWLLTDIECVVLDEGEMPSDLELPSGSETLGFPDAVWLSGKRLAEIIDGRRIQFVWCVLSGFEPDIEIDPSNLEVHPFAEGNPGFWQPSVSIQHPRASVEIVCSDSTLSLLLSNDDDLTRRFREFFPEAVDLDVYNRRREEARR